MTDFIYNNKYSEKTVTSERMIKVWKMLRTPFKRGAVMEFDDRFTDCPGVFRHKDRWYMIFIAISKDTSVSGYETHLAESDDLLNWTYVGKIFERDESRVWDSKQIAGYPALYDTKVGGWCDLSTFDDKYWMTYLAGASDGYEPDPLLVGIASSSDPIDVNSYVRNDKPILTPQDDDARFFETKTLYKSAVIEDEERLTGHRFVMFYNAKASTVFKRAYRRFVRG